MLYFSLQLGSIIKEEKKLTHFSFYWIALATEHPHGVMRDLIHAICYKGNIEMLQINLRIPVEIIVHYSCCHNQHIIQCLICRVDIWHSTRGIITFMREQRPYAFHNCFISWSQQTQLISSLSWFPLGSSAPPGQCFWEVFSSFILLHSILVHLCRSGGFPSFFLNLLRPTLLQSFGKYCSKAWVLFVQAGTFGFSDLHNSCFLWPYSHCGHFLPLAWKRWYF